MIKVIFKQSNIYHTTNQRLLMKYLILEQVGMNIINRFKIMNNFYVGDERFLKFLIALFGELNFNLYSYWRYKSDALTRRP